MAARWTVALALVVSMNAAAQAQTSSREIREDLAAKVALFNLCPAERHMDLHVEVYAGGTPPAGLTREGVRDTIERLLRGARVFDVNAGPLLEAQIILGAPEEGRLPFYSIQLFFHRELLAENLGESALAATWSTGLAGEGDIGSFHDGLEGFIDAFIAEHRAVSESEACRALRDATPRTTPSGGAS